MRTPQDVAARPPRSRGRARWWIIIVIAVVVVLLASLRSLATLYTDSLWFSSVGLHSVFSKLLAVKVGLFASFGAIFFVGLWVNLLVADRMGRHATDVADITAEDELVRRYQQVVRPYSGKLYVALAVILALIAAAGTIGEWNNWLLFTHYQSFGVSDPEFHKDVGFYVFRLPFLSFLVNWFLISTVVVLVVTIVFHYLNGGIRAQRVTPRVRPAVKAHLSVILALIALLKAAGYVLARYDLVVSNNGYVTGAGYTDVHARIPAIDVLFFVSLAAAAILLYNIRRQGWTLPVLAIGIWAFVALVIGVIYPAVLQVLRVNPAQSALEQPYIARNISATRAAYGLENVTSKPFAASTTIAPGTISDNTSTINNIRLWDPDPNISLETYQKLQGAKSYYIFQSLGVDRYTVGGQLTPVLMGVRQLNPANLPSTSWVSTHLQYTHGIGVALGLANQAQSNGNPVFGVQDVPPTSNDGLANLTQPGVYFGLQDPGFVVANTKTPEINYQGVNGTQTSHYSGTGGVRLNSLLTKAAFAIRLGDFNLLISNLITDQSRIMFVRDIQAMAQKAAPFLSFDADPYAVMVNGHIDWVEDAYTTTAQYPYSQDSDTQQVPPGSGLPGNYNYVRNSVKVVIDAYSGAITYYAMTNNDPILRSYEAAFPKLFTPASAMPSTLQDHLRYPEDIFSIQTAVYGRYHISSPTDFYNAANAWNISPTSGAGSPSNALAVTTVTNAQGQEVLGPLQRMAPLYQVQGQPDSTKQQFLISDAYVPASQGNQSGNQSLTAFMMATAPRPGAPGKLTLYVTPNSSTPPIGPVQADSEMQSNSNVSHDITLLDQHGSSVLLGNTLMVPLGQSMLYVRPLYVTSTSNVLPQLNDVIAVLGTHVGIESNVEEALSDVIQAPVAGATPNSGGGTSSTPLPTGESAQVSQLLAQASADYAAAQAALKNQDLATYQAELAAMAQAISQAQALIAASGASTSTTTTTLPKAATTTTKPASSGDKGTTTTTAKLPAATAGPSTTTTTVKNGV